MPTKTSSMKLALFDKPLHYEHEIITNLEEISFTNIKNSKELNKNFQNITNILDNASSKVISTIQNEAEKSRIHQSIENEKISRGISETNYRLLNVVKGIDGLGDIIYDSSSNIIKTIEKSSQQIIEQLNKSNHRLVSVDFKMEAVNNSLNLISNQLTELIEKISKPNETAALELVDQARINLSLNKPERAIKVTREALELSNGTSITVLAYHILTLSLFNDDKSKKEILEIYNDYINLVKFKLKDKQSDIDVVIQELNNTLFPVMAAIGYYLDKAIIANTQSLYVSLYQLKNITDSVLRKPISEEETRKLISYPNHLREYHWIILLNEYVINSDKLKDYIDYISALKDSDVLIKNELSILAIKYFDKNNLLYGAIIDCLANDDNKNLKEVLEYITYFLPQDIIEVDYKTYWALKIFVDKYEIKTNSLLEKKFISAKSNVEKDVKSYNIVKNNMEQEIKNKENEIYVQIDKIEQEYQNKLKEKKKIWIEQNNIAEDFYSKYLEQSKIVEYFDENRDSIVIAINSVLAFILFIGLFSEMNFELSAAIIIIFLIYNMGNIIDFFKAFPESKKEKYQKEMKKKYDISLEKEKLYSPYKEKIESLLSELKTYKKERENNIKFSLINLIILYLPLRRYELKASHKKIKEIINNTVLNIFIDRYHF